MAQRTTRFMPDLSRFLLPLALVAFGACTDRASGTDGLESVLARTETAPEADMRVGTVPYALSQPDARWMLPSRLREISGLGMTDDGRLLAVQDEDGDLFEIDPASGATTSTRAFYNSGDYEGVEPVGDVTWIVESDGDLYRFTGSEEAEKRETGLSRSNDVEGLAYDARGNRLLLACKGDPGGGRKGVRTIYAYDLAAERLDPDPVFTLDREVLDEGGAPFKPSGLAVHPGTGEIYIISGVRKALVVLSPEGDLTAAVSLPPRLYPQPEGIAFARDGTLFISNEGGGGSATLLRFSPQPLP